VNAAEYSENIYDMAKAKDWKAASARLRELQAASRQLSIDLPREKGSIAALDTEISVIARGVAAKNRLGAMRDANQATRITAGISGSFHPVVPMQIALLDYGGRELEVWSANTNEAKLKATARGIKQNWATVRSQVVAHGGRMEATKFDRLVASVDAAKSPHQYNAVAMQILAEVDNLEKVFGP
jgi:hypothetical protein